MPAPEQTGKLTQVTGALQPPGRGVAVDGTKAVDRALRHWKWKLVQEGVKMSLNLWEEVMAILE